MRENHRAGVGDRAQAIGRFVREAPKVDLHIHLVGSASPTTVARLARRASDPEVPRSESELRGFFEFTDFEHFIEVYELVNSLVRSGSDIADLVTGAARDLASQGIRYAEMTVTPYSHVTNGIPYGEVVEGLTVGRAMARELGVEFAWVFDIPGQFGQDAAHLTVGFAVDDPPAGLVGFGIAGSEAGVDRRDYGWAFDVARAAGLRSVPHAGEADGPSSVWAALDVLEADRIGHGVRSVEDPKLLERIVDEQIPLEVCPSSNICTGVFPTLREHSIGRLLDAGAFVTINSDDPPMFGTTLIDEYLKVAATFDLGLHDVANLVANGIRASFLPDDQRRVLLTDVDTTLRSIDAQD